MIDEQLISKIALILGKNIQDKTLKVLLYRCPDCHRFIAIPEYCLKSIRGLNLSKLHCPFCENTDIKLIEKTDRNAEYYECYEEDLSSFEKYPIVNVCSHCLFSFFSFERNLNDLRYCPLCAHSFLNEVGLESLHVKIHKKISDELLDNIEKAEQDERVIKDEAESLISFSDLTNKKILLKLYNQRSAKEYFCIGFNFDLNMMILGEANKKSNDDLIIHWIKLSDIERITQTND